MGNFGQDIRFALRTMRKAPGFTAVAVITLALGIGANTAIFTVINAVFFNPMPVKDAGRLVNLYTIDPPVASPTCRFPSLTARTSRARSAPSLALLSTQCSVPA